MFGLTMAGRRVALGIAAAMGLSAMSAGVAQAAQGPWRVFDKGDEQSILVDRSGISHSGNGGQLTSAVTFSSVQHIEGVEGFYFIVAVEEIDCVGVRLRDTHLKAFDKSGTQIWDGGETPDVAWDVQPKGSVGAAKVKLVCEGDWDGATVDYGSLTQARAALYPGT